MSDNEIENAVRTVPCQTGQTLSELSAGQTVMVVFLRHAGCTFCREALSDIAQVRHQLEASGVMPVFVNLSSETAFRSMLNRNGLSDLPYISDPKQILYRAFGLKNGTVSQLLGPKVLWKGFQAALLRRHGFGWMDGNGLRMPGVFLLRDGKILGEYRHQTAADRPDYVALACDASARCSSDSL